MKADALLVIMCILMVYIAWIVTGGPNKPISHAGPFITPVTRSGEESQGYRVTPPTNPIAPNSLPRQVGGTSETISKPSPTTNTQTSGSLDLHAR